MKLTRTAQTIAPGRKSGNAWCVVYVGGPSGPVIDSTSGAAATWQRSIRLRRIASPTPT